MITHNLYSVLDRIRAAEQSSGRPTGSCKLMVAAKHQGAPAIMEVMNAGTLLFGHNQVQQLVNMVDGLRNGHHPLANKIFTSMIGHVQSNKLSTAMEYAHRIDTVDSIKAAERIARRQRVRIEAGEASTPYPILLQVNSSGATTQFGCDPDELVNIASVVQQSYAGLVQIDGIMTIGAQGSQDQVRRSFILTRELSQELRRIDGLANAEVISMGMTQDLELAVAEGSTEVRIGTAIFGSRPV